MVKLVTSIRYRAQYIEYSWRCYSATVADYYLLGCSRSTVSYPSGSLASCVFLLLTESSDFADVDDFCLCVTAETRLTYRRHLLTEQRTGDDDGRP